MYSMIQYTHSVYARQRFQYSINCPNPNKNLSAYSEVIAGVVSVLLKHHCTIIDLTGDL